MDLSDETWSPSLHSGGPSQERARGRGEKEMNVTAGTSRAAGESGESRGRPAARGKGRGRGRGTRGRMSAGERGTAFGVSEEDRVRVERLQEERRSQTQELIENMSQDDATGLLQRVMDREPRLIFDVLQLAHQRPEAPVEGGPQWCRCTRCRLMPTDIQNKCCRMDEANCISRLPHMALFILDEHVLHLSRRLRNDIYALHDTQEPGDDNQEYRHAAYRNFVLWQCGALGARNRVVILSCCVWRIRDKYPDPNGQYTGFISAVL
ncbi:hypothetical protein ABVT39_007775 [Epinephelus coioides]